MTCFTVVQIVNMLPVKQFRALSILFPATTFPRVAFHGPSHRLLCGRRPCSCSHWYVQRCTKGPEPDATSQWNARHAHITDTRVPSVDRHEFKKRTWQPGRPAPPTSSRKLVGAQRHQWMPAVHQGNLTGNRLCHDTVL